MRAINIIGNEETLGTGSSVASSISNAILVRVLHPNTTNNNTATIYRISATNGVIGSFSLDHSGPQYVFKDPSDKLYTDQVGEVKAAPVTFMY